MLKAILDELSGQLTIVLVCDEGDLPACIEHKFFLENGRLVDMISEPEAKALDEELIEKLQSDASADFKVAIHFNKANVTYGKVHALSNLTWTVKKGEKWALMGPNGSGKSTIISLITADNPQAYRNDIILFDQKRGTGESIWDIKKKIGFVSPELQLYCEKDLAVWQLVASGLFDTAGLYQTLKDSQLQIVFNYIKLIGIQDIAERKFTQLSTGEQRLAFLARALVKNPPLLILDEPCQGLDYGQMIHFRSIIDKIVPSFNKTLIYVTHYEEELPNCVDRRLDISEGEIARNLEL